MPIEIASVEEQYKKFPEEFEREEVLKLIEWHDKQPHLPEVTELEAIRFLHACKFSVEKTKLCMDSYYTIRTHCPEFFGKRDVLGADVTAQMNVTAPMLLEGTTKEGYRVILCKLTDIDAHKFSFVDSLKLYFMITDLWLAREDVVEGYVFVLDMEGATLAHLAKVNLIAMKKFMHYIQEALPARLKAIHFINTVSFLDKLLVLMRPFMKNELMDLIHLHSSLEHTNIPKSAMPDEYGGYGGKVKDIQSEVNKELQDNAQFFIDEERTKRVNERLRPGKAKTENDLFGTSGNFRRLSLF